MESWTRRILLLRVSVHRQFHFTHQQLSEYTVLHSRLHRIETKAALRDHGKCKFSCVVPLYVLPSSHHTCRLFRVLTNSLLFKWFKACAGLGILEDVQNSSFKLAASLISLWGVAWWTCIQNVGALRMLRECCTRCHLEMWSLGLPWYWDMCNVGNGWRHWNYFDKCNSRVCDQTLSLLWGCWMYVPALQLKRAGVFFNKSLNADGIQMSLWQIAWFTCMGMWEHGECSESVQQDAMNGHGNEALKYFEQMCEEDVQPDDITFICLLSACSHAGLVDKGMHF